MRYLSVCSGIEAASYAWHSLGWEPVAFSEIEAVPRSILAERFPGVRNLGDFTGIRNRWLRRLGIGSIDLLVGGTPCQSFSVAGLRGGMADARGNLALEFLRLARRTRPRWIVWENVPGVLSSWTDEASSEAAEGSCRDVESARRAVIEAGIDLGAEFGAGEFEEVDQTNDFACFLAGLEELGYGWAYRVLDAQHFGVPQRRRRVFVVGYSGNVGRLGSPPSRQDLQRFSRVSSAVLFERHSLSGDPPPCRSARSDVAASLGGGSGDRGWCDDLDRAGAFIPDTAHGLLSKQNLSHREDADTLVAFSSHGHGQFREGLGMVTARDGKDGFHSGLVTHIPDVAFGLQSSAGRNENGSRIGNAWNTNYVAHTLRGEGFDASEDGTGRGTPLVPDVSPTLFASTGGASSGYHPVVPIDLRQASRGEKDTNNRSIGSGGPTGVGVGNPGDPAFTVSERGQAVAFNWQGGGKQTSLGFAPDSGITGTLGVGQEIAVAYQCQGSNVGPMGTMRSGNGNTTGGVPFIVNAAESCAKQSHARQSETARCLDQTGGFASSQGGTVVAAFDPRNVTSNVNRTRVEPGLPCPTLHEQGMSIIGPGVRRLTPVECERLQGFPDDWTLVTHRGKPTADGPRYRACGNSMATVVMHWLGARIDLVKRVLGV